VNEPHHPGENRYDPATMAIGEVLKADKDFTKEADAAIPEAEKLGSVRGVAYTMQAMANTGD
jgi:hypothetical protein